MAVATPRPTRAARGSGSLDAMPTRSASSLPGSTPRAARIASARPRPNQSPGPVRTRSRAPGIRSRASGIPGRASTTLAPSPRTWATGTAPALPLTRSPAAATSSATAVAVTSRARPSASTPPRRSFTTSIPKAPSAKSVCPVRQGRPAVSLRTIPSRVSDEMWHRRVWSSRHTPSGSWGRSRRWSAPPVFEASTPAAAMTGPPLALTTRVIRSPVVRSARTQWLSAAMTACRSVDGAVSPRAFEAILLETTRTSPSSRVRPDAARAVVMSSARSSPARTSGMPTSGVSVRVTRGSRPACGRGRPPPRRCRRPCRCRTSAGVVPRR